MKKISVVVALAIVSVLAVGIMPAGAAGEAGVGITAAVVSPDLNSGFPAGLAEGDGNPFHAVRCRLGLTTTDCVANVPQYLPAGDLYARGEQGVALNELAVGGAGVAGTTNYAVAGAGQLAATYTYAEPCQNGQPAFGEATGNLTITTDRAGVVQIGTGLPNSSTAHQVKIARFNWSRVGVTALVILDGVSVNDATTLANPDVNDANALGVAGALFQEQPGALNCAGGPNPPANAVLIETGAVTLGNPT